MTEMQSAPDEQILRETPDVAEVVEAVFGCKWSLRILGLIRKGVCRPGAIEKELTGLTTKVQNYYFRRMITLGILERIVYPEVPPHVEYQLTDFGRRFMPILDSIEQLQHELETLKGRDLEPYTLEMSARARSLIDGVVLDDD